jgi:cytochrome c oxidase cbb3-type subunit 3
MINLNKRAKAMFKKRCYRGIVFLAALAAAVTSANHAFAATAEENYKFYCSQCHGLQGDGKGPNAASLSVAPRNHANTAEMGKLSDADVVNAIKGGGAAVNKSVMMPPWGNTLTADEVTALKDYLRKLCKCQGPA